MKSGYLKLTPHDFAKGLIVSVLSSVLTIMYQTIETGSLVFNWKAIGTVAIMSAMGYILKNLVTNSNDEFLKKEPSETPAQ